VSDVKRFNLFTLALLAALVLFLVAGCCTCEPTRYAAPHVLNDTNKPLQTLEFRYGPTMYNDSTIELRARARVEQWKREGWK
jgi:hypothetical protein